MTLSPLISRHASTTKKFSYKEIKALLVGYDVRFPNNFKKLNKCLDIQFEVNFIVSFNMCYNDVELEVNHL